MEVKTPYEVAIEDFENAIVSRERAYWIRADGDTQGQARIDADAQRSVLLSFGLQSDENGNRTSTQEAEILVRKWRVDDDNDWESEKRAQERLTQVKRKRGERAGHVIEQLINLILIGRT